ncbi:MAG: MarR family transcriptional regulator [Microbacteriaceae bacterium]|nr:MarR family transcriptional regulator [Microbacteriaceae bacterium]
MTTPRLGDAEERLWRAIMHLGSRLPSILENDLQRAAGISLSEFAALMRLSEAEDGAMRPGELAEAIDLSPSRVTRLVAELEARGFVERNACVADARGTLAVITATGREVLARAVPAQIERARELVFDAIPLAEVERLAGAMGGIADRAACPTALSSGPAAR